MRRFVDLYLSLDASTATADKVAALVNYFREAPPDDAAWAVYFLCGGKPRQVVPTALLRETVCAAAGIDDWLFEACYQTVGDLAETIAHVLPPPRSTADQGLAIWVTEGLLPLRDLPPESQAQRLREAFDRLDADGRFLLVKLIGGGFRVGVSRLLVQRALSEVSGLDAKVVAQRLVGWTDARAQPDARRYLALVAVDPAETVDAGHPYPFFLAHPLPADQPLAQALGPLTDWLVEWKYDGIRAQLVRRAREVWIWSRGEELLTERFPEVAAAARQLPDGCVLDGELLAWVPRSPQPLPFQRLQQRITRKTLTRKVLAEVPVRFLAYDLLEWQGQDVRTQTQAERRRRLEDLLAGLADVGESGGPVDPAGPGAPVDPTPAVAPIDPGSITGRASTSCSASGVIGLSPKIESDDESALGAWRAEARARGVEGLMFKHRSSRYGQGRTKSDGVWWKWKVDPLSVDAVLIYAQAGHGRRAGLYTDYTFAVWSRPPASRDEAQAVVDAIARREPAQPGALQLVAFAKAYSGLSDAEFARVDRVIRATTLEKFGPVRSVVPSLVFELAFEGLNDSPRHKSGVAVRFPRMLRIRDDKPLHEADTLQTLRALMGAAGA